MKFLYCIIPILFLALLGGTAAAGPDALPPSSTITRGDAVQTYNYLMKTRIRTFVLPTGSPTPQAGGPGIGTYALLAAPGLAFGASNPYMLGTTLLTTAMFAGSVSSMERYSNPAYLPGPTPGRSSITLTLWDNALLNARVLYFACKDVAMDASQIESYRQALLSQYPAGSETVIEVQITNGGLAPLHLSPFSWHLYLFDSNGNRTKPIGYDSDLDSPIDPGQTVTGKAYFPPGAPSRPVRGILEDVSGKTFSFSIGP